MLNKAIEIAAKAHAGQLDKGGNPYILHPLRVMMSFGGDLNENEKICAVLHDVVEDTGITLDDLKREGFSDDIIAALDCMTKRDGESYNDFIRRILNNGLACKVKNRDLADNMDLTRIANPTENDMECMRKYSEASKLINEALANDSSESRHIKVKGVARMQSSVSFGQFHDLFTGFYEAHGWLFSGSITETAGKPDFDSMNKAP